MEKIAIMVDSAADISYELSTKKGIYYLPLYVNVGGRFLKDRIDIDPDEFYEIIKESESLPKTSMPSPGDAISLAEKIRDDGYDKLLIINIGSKFSGTYNMCNNIEVDGLDIHAFDTGNLTMGEGFFALYAKKLVDAGISFEKLIENLRDKLESSKVFFTIESFKYIVAGGRVPKSFGKIGDALSVKPIITTLPEAGFKLSKIVRGDKRVFKEFIKLAKQNLDNSKSYYFFIGHGGAEELANSLEEKLRDFVDGASIFIKEQISPTLGANTGPGLFGFALFTLD